MLSDLKSTKSILFYMHRTKLLYIRMDFNCYLMVLIYLNIFITDLTVIEKNMQMK